jgi:hypothetical protein
MAHHASLALTNEFLAGRRVRYVHPLRVYLLASIVFFFVVNYWAKSIHLDARKLSDKDRAEVAAELDKEDIPPELKARIRSAIDEKGLGATGSPNVSVTRSHRRTATECDRFAAAAKCVTVSLRRLRTDDAIRQTAIGPI